MHPVLFALVYGLSLALVYCRGYHKGAYFVLAAWKSYLDRARH
jgi:hypothetical protein